MVGDRETKNILLLGRIHLMLLSIQSSCNTSDSILPAFSLPLEGLIVLCPKVRIDNNDYKVK